MDPYTEKSLNALQQELDTLEQNAGKASPDFYFIARLIEQAAEKPPGVQQHLSKTIATKLAQLRDAVKNDCEPKKDTVHRTNSLAELKALTASLSREQPATSSQSRGIDFDDFLRDQEKQLLQSMTGTAAATSQASDGFVELGANRRFRQMQLQQFADDLVEQSIRHAPDNPGPLNPQMLAIRSLSAMRDLSPHYLNRFVGAIDSLFWLEQTGAKHKKTSAKKTR